MTCPASASWSKRPTASNVRGRGKSCPTSGATPNIPTYRRATRRRCANGRRWGSASDVFVVSGLAMTSRLRPGVIAAIAVLALDQASKLWLLFVFDIVHHGAVRVTPFFDLVLTWNVG